jgi:hypothetical protein
MVNAVEIEFTLDETVDIVAEKIAAIISPAIPIGIRLMIK